MQLSVDVDETKKSGKRLVGDVEFDAVKSVASWITPVPGGVGPMTVVMLLSNTVLCAERLATQQVCLLWSLCLLVCLCVFCLSCHVFLCLLLCMLDCPPACPTTHPTCPHTIHSSQLYGCPQHRSFLSSVAGTNAVCLLFVKQQRVFVLS